MSSSATGVGMTICFLGAILLILTQKSSQKFGDVLGIMVILLMIVLTFALNVGQKFLVILFFVHIVGKSVGLTRNFVVSAELLCTAKTFQLTMQLLSL